MHTIRHAPPRSWRDAPPAIARELLLWNFADLFTRLSFQLFLSLISAWPLCPGRRTVTRMITVADPHGEHAHDAYHRFLRAGKWSVARLWCRLARLLVASLDLPKELRLHGDDTLFHKSGRKVKGAGSRPYGFRELAAQAAAAKRARGTAYMRHGPPTRPSFARNTSMILVL